METINEVMMSGKDIQKWHDEKIKDNDKSWVAALFLALIMWLGHSTIKYNDYLYKTKELRSENKKLKKEIAVEKAYNNLYKSHVLTLQQAVDSAVYINEIISGSDKKK